VNERSEVMMVEKEVPRPVGKETDRGVMVVVAGKSSYGYAATSALTHEGIKHAFNEALRCCELTKNNSVSGVAQFPRHNHKAQYKTRFKNHGKPFQLPPNLSFW
jgi:predicted Zn-dependent protease